MKLKIVNTDIRIKRIRGALKDLDHNKLFFYPKFSKIIASLRTVLFGFVLSLYYYET